MQFLYDHIQESNGGIGLLKTLHRMIVEYIFLGIFAFVSGSLMGSYIGGTITDIEIAVMIMSHILMVMTLIESTRYTMRYLNERSLK